MKIFARLLLFSLGSLATSVYFQRHRYLETTPPPSTSGSTIRFIHLHSTRQFFHQSPTVDQVRIPICQSFHLTSNLSDLPAFFNSFNLPANFFASSAFQFRQLVTHICSLNFVRVASIDLYKRNFEALSN